MKPHEPKNKDKTREKKKGETKGDKKPNQKKRKGNKTPKKQRKGTGKKHWQKGNKREGTEDQGFGTWIASFHFLLFITSTLVIHQSLKSLLTGSSHVKFGRPLSLFSLPVHLIIILPHYELVPPWASVGYV
jgi:hypothetical protein